MRRLAEGSSLNSPRRGAGPSVNRKRPTSALQPGWSPVPGQPGQNPQVSVLLVVLGSGWFWVGSVWLMNWLSCGDSVSRDTDAGLVLDPS